MTKNKASKIYVVSLEIDYEGLCEPVAWFTSPTAAQKYADKRGRDEDRGKYARYVVHGVECHDE
jgi:hypothetical protein